MKKDKKCARWHVFRSLSEQVSISNAMGEIPMTCCDQLAYVLCKLQNLSHQFYL